MRNQANSSKKKAHSLFLNGREVLITSIHQVGMLDPGKYTSCVRVFVLHAQIIRAVVSTPSCENVMCICSAGRWQKHIIA